MELDLDLLEFGRGEMMMLGIGDLNVNRASQAFGDSAMETLKQAMLQHELIFRNQVRELHRLYWTQKTLMNELRAKGFDACWPWLAATDFRESANGNAACLESYCATEMGSSIARNVGALEEVKGDSVDALLKYHQRNCSVQLPANYILEKEISRDAIDSVSERGNLGCGTGMLIVEKGIRQRAGIFRSKEAIVLEDECHGEVNEELYGSLELPMKKRRSELCSKPCASSDHVSSSIVSNDMCRISMMNLSEQQREMPEEQKLPLSFAGPGESDIAAAFDQSNNKLQSKLVLIDLNLPHQNAFSHNLDDPVSVPFPINDSSFHREAIIPDSYHVCREETSFASKPNSSNSAGKTSCMSRASCLFPPFQVPQFYAQRDSEVALNTSNDDGQYCMKPACEIRAEFCAKPVEGSTGSTNGAFLDNKREAISPSGKLQFAAHSDNKMQHSNITSSNSINLPQTSIRDQEDTLSSHSIAKDPVGTSKESKCRSDGEMNTTIAAVSITDESVTTQLNSPKNRSSSFEELNANISAAAEVLMSISLGRSAVPGQHLDVIEEAEINQHQYSSDSFESMTLQLSEIQSEDQFTALEQLNTNGSLKEDNGMRLRRGRGLRDFQKEIMPGLATLSRHEICEDLHNIGHRFRRSAARIARENWFFSPVRSRSARQNH